MGNLFKNITRKQLTNIIKQVAAPLARGKFNAINGDKAKMSELIPSHDRDPDATAPDNFQHTSPFGFISHPTKNVLGYFLNFMGLIQSPTIINHIHIKRPTTSGPGETIIYSTDISGTIVRCSITFKSDGTMNINADTKVNIIAPDVDVTATGKVKVTASDVEIDGTTKVLIKSAASVTVDAPLMKFGPAATEAIIKGTAFKLFFDTHVHPDPATGNTGVPVVPMPPTLLSTKSKTE